MSSNQKILEIEALLAPIAGENPSGQDLRYELLYDEIREARRADDTLARGEWQREVKTSDWKEVISIATKTLSKKSKDLQIAGWLSEALTCEYGFAGLKEGLQLIREFLIKFWDTLYPVIEDRDLDYRIGPLEWLNRTLAILIKQIPIAENKNTGKFTLQDYDRAQKIENLKAQDQNAYKELSDDEKGLHENFEKVVSETPREFYELQSEELKNCFKELELLDEVGDEKFEKEAPGFSAIKKSLEECQSFVEGVLKKKPKPEQPKKEEIPAPEVLQEIILPGKTEDKASEPADAEKEIKEPEAATDPAKDAIQESPPPLTPEKNPAQPVAQTTTRSQTPQELQEALRQLFEFAAALREKKPNSPIPYLILRAVRWGEIREGGNHLDSSQLTAPSKETRQKLKKLYDENQKIQLLTESERCMMREEGRAWLDLQFYTFQALGTLGSGSRNIKNALRSELQAYLTDYAELPVMELSDGSSAASSETQKWLRSEILTQNGATEISNSREAAAGVDEGLWAQAVAKVKAGKFSAGLALLQKEVMKSQSERARFLGKLCVAELCLIADKPGLAKPILHELRDYVERFSLNKWEEKSINVRVWQAFVRCYRSLEHLTEKEKECLNIAFEKLCQLDIEQALALDEE